LPGIHLHEPEIDVQGIKDDLRAIEEEAARMRSGEMSMNNSNNNNSGYK
jgi:hypothetical protein